MMLYLLKEDLSNQTSAANKIAKWRLSDSSYRAVCLNPTVPISLVLCVEWVGRKV
jgi:hypothetical protein